MPIVKEVEPQLNIIINVYAISVAPHGEDGSNEVANRLMWESFIVPQENQGMGGLHRKYWTIVEPSQ